MSQSNKRSGIGFSAEDVPEPPAKRLSLDPASNDFLEAQTHYAKIRHEIQSQFLDEKEKEFRKIITNKVKTEIRRGLVLDVQEENRKLLMKQKEKIMQEIRAQVKEEIEKDVGMMPEREERVRERIRKEVREEMNEERKREVEEARREARYECEEKIGELEERITELEEKVRVLEDGDS